MSNSVYQAPPSQTTWHFRFPTNLSLGARGGPSWATRITSTTAGFEMRRAMRGSSLGVWVVGHNLRTPAQWAQLLAFHRFAVGQLDSFRFQDWLDYTVTSGQGVLVASPLGNTMLAKVYTLTDLFNNTYTATRIITRPQPNTVIFSPGGPSVNYATGVVSGGTIGITTWTGNFDVPARFSSDEIDMAREQVTASGWRSIMIEEVLVEI